MKKRGRPKLNNKNKKMEVIQIRIKKEDKKKLEEKIEEDFRFENISQFIRYKIREYLNEE